MKKITIELTFREAVSIASILDVLEKQFELDANYGGFNLVQSRIFEEKSKTCGEVARRISEAADKFAKESFDEVMKQSKIKEEK